MPQGTIATAFVVGGLGIGILTGYAEHGPWRRLPPAFVRAGWALGVLSIAALLHVLPPCSWGSRLVLVGGLFHLLWPLLSYADQHAYAYVDLAAESVLLAAATVLLLQQRRLPEALLTLLLLVWAGVMIPRHDGI